MNVKTAGERFVIKLPGAVSAPGEKY